MDDAPAVSRLGARAMRKLSAHKGLDGAPAVRRLGARAARKLSAPAVRRLGWCSCCEKACNRSRWSV